MAESDIDPAGSVYIAMRKVHRKHRNTEDFWPPPGLFRKRADGRSPSARLDRRSQ